MSLDSYFLSITTSPCLNFNKNIPLHEIFVKFHSLSEWHACVKTMKLLTIKRVVKHLIVTSYHLNGSQLNVEFILIIRFSIQLFIIHLKIVESDHVFECMRFHRGKRCICCEWGCSRTATASKAPCGTDNGRRSKSTNVSDTLNGISHEINFSPKYFPS